MKQQELNLLQSNSENQSKRKQSGESTSQALLSSHVCDNSELFPRILKLFVKDGAKIADITYGTGVFWKNVDRKKYKFYPSDIKTGVDARNLPYESDSFDAVVLDPPYMEGLLRSVDDEMAGSGTHSQFRSYYSEGKGQAQSELKWHDRVIDIYMRAAIEAYRVLKTGGIFIVKCQDEVSANRQKLTHVEIIYGLERLGFYCKDLFVITRTNKPIVARMLKQEHARKNHSYFLIFVAVKGKKLPYSNFGKLLESYSASTEKNKQIKKQK